MPTEAPTIESVAKRKPSKRSGTSKPNRTGKPLHVWIPEQLRDAIDVMAERTRRPLTTEVVIALEEYLTKHGLWPPPPPEPPPE